MVLSVSFSIFFSYVDIYISIITLKRRSEKNYNIDSYKSIITELHHQKSIRNNSKYSLRSKIKEVICRLICNLRQEETGHGAVAGVGRPRCHGWLNGLASPSSKAGCLVRFSRGTVSWLLLPPPY